MDKIQHVQKDMQTSIKYVRKYKDTIMKMLHAANMFQVEGDPNEICQMLDLTCGTDYFTVSTNGVVWGIASRVQYIEHGHRPYNSFTVRYRRESGAITEYEKRLYAMTHKGVYPAITMQMYIDDETDELLSIGFAKTDDIWAFIKDGHADECVTGNDKIGQATFKVCYWSNMQKQGIKVLTA